MGRRNANSPTTPSLFRCASAFTDINFIMKIKKIARFLFIVSLSIFVVTYFYLKFSWLTVYSYSDMKYNAKIVDTSITTPNNFLKIWDKIYPSTRNNRMTKQLWSGLTRELAKSSFYDCKCDEIGYLAWNNNYHNFKFNVDKQVGKYRQFGYGLTFFTTPEKCFDFWLNNDIIWKGQYLKNLNELSIINFNKNITSLNQTEIIQLIAFRNLGYTQSKDTILFKETTRILEAKFLEN